MSDITLAQMGGRTVYHSVMERREDGHTWLGGYFDEYDFRGNFVKRGETHWTGYYTWSRGIDDPEIRARLPLWQRIAYRLGCFT